MANYPPTPTPETSPQMFDKIAPSYDLVNRLLSFGIDSYWRSKLCSFIPQGEKIRLFDGATGTADQIISLMEKIPSIEKAVGLDLSEGMLEVGRGKIAKKGYASKVSLEVGSLLKIPYPENSFTSATLSFGIRNIPSPVKALQEMHRILIPGGVILILEFSLPRSLLLRKAHLTYLRHIVPRVGGWVSKKREAYRYLNETIEAFPYGEAFLSLMREAGFTHSTALPLTGGIATLYRGVKE